MDEPSAQLEADLHDSLRASLAARRPIIHHLNADSSWLIQIPRPDSAVRNGGRFFYNILIDPWLRGSQVDLASWFSRQWHATPSAVDSIAAVEELAREVEILGEKLREGLNAKGRSVGAGRNKSERKSNTQVELESGQWGTYIDCVTISHEFTDHCHRQTLLQVKKGVPVLATREAARLIRGWDHFETVITISEVKNDAEFDWRRSSLELLPDWLGVARILSRMDPVSLHSGLLICFNSASQPSSTAATDEDAAEGIIYTPHGIYPDNVDFLKSVSPPIHHLALLHGVYSVSLSKGPQINLGGRNGLKIKRKLDSRYWIATHDEVKQGRGLINWILRSKLIPFGDALEREIHQEDMVNDRDKKSCTDSGPEHLVEQFKTKRWEVLGNGESRVLY
ncbi:hypothetical protein K431DRAFT_284986 [Polychaeton citri CBS 116435]|uniref:Uncharacterized protein n=1 Tax=Polychaeton citri CBS 116435 TaxID=1314669 RepID=A0A9P4UML9_9PEZI|nr:hypothetical protein K431DRAFT_284986 [Polychaeton citri CBS 116435]